VFLEVVLKTLKILLLSMLFCLQDKNTYKIL